MSDTSDAAIITALRREMSRAVARQVASASNLANVETPGYKAVEPEFRSTLDGKLGAGVALATTNPGHLQGTASPSTADTKETEGLSTRRDGNNVQLDRELLTMVQASTDFAKAQAALTAKFRLVRYAISGGS